MKPLLPALGRQDWIRFGLRNRLVRIFDDPDEGRDEAFESPFFGLRYPGNLNTFIDWSVYYFGAYAVEELACMHAVLAGKPEAVVLDIGANVGHHTLFASTVAAAVHAFEPFAPLAARIHEKIRVNQLENVTVHPIGLGNANTRIPYSPSSTSNSGTGSFGAASERSLELEVRRGDDYFAGAGIERVDYVKTDVEGFEVEVLKGLAETLRRTRPVCFVEWSQSGRSAVAGPDLFPPDYVFHRFLSNVPRLWVFNACLFRLTPLAAPWPDGHVLATPREFWETHRVVPSGIAPLH